LQGLVSRISVAASSHFNPLSSFKSFVKIRKMYKIAVLVALCIAFANGGVVDPAYRCGGVGTPIQLRISDCEGRCRFQPGKPYDCEEDFMPSGASASLTLKVEICLNGSFCMVIIDTVLPNSSVQPGFVYTAKYTIVPNDQLSGQSVEFKGSIFRTEAQLLEICVSADADVL